MGNAQNRERGQSASVVSPSTRASAADSAFSFDQHQQHQRRRPSVGLHDEDPLVLPLSRRRVSDGVQATAAPPTLTHQQSLPAGVPSRCGAATEEEEEPATRSDKPLLPVVIQWKKGGRDVQLCGSFTNWRPVPMARSESTMDSEHMSIVNLPAGRHEYKFRIDGEWVVDTNEPTTVTPEGDRNNYITVQPDDFAACEALNLETVPTGDVSGSPPGEYGRDMPASRGAPWNHRAPAAPPALPPHLLQVILNKDTPVSCEPTLLPAPNHVMLNHLYALSIKDGVMVLSATHRYRKKYVTTLLYKPI